jgi:hypothetical protein
VRLGNTIISLKHAPPKDLPLGNPMSALVFQALRYLGREAIGQETIARLRRRLSPEERWRLLKDAHHTTDWVAAVVRKVCAVGDDPGGASHG